MITVFAYQAVQWKDGKPLKNTAPAIRFTDVAPNCGLTIGEIRIDKKSGRDQDLPIGVYRRVRKGRPGIWYRVNLEINGQKKSTFKRSLEDALAQRMQWQEESFKEYRKAI